MNGRFTRLEFDEEGRRRQQREEARMLEGTPPRNGAHFAALALESQQLGHFEKALQLYTRAVRDDRGLVQAWVGQVQMLVQLGECAEARLWSDKALELFRDNGELLAAKAQACLRQGDLASGTACSDASLRSPGMSPWRWEVRGEALLVRGESLFRTCFQKAMAEPAADWFDHLVVAGILLFHGHAAAALEYAQQAVGLRASHPYCWLVLGQCQASLGWNDDAQITFNRCLELTPRLDEAARAIEALRRQSVLGRLARRMRSWFQR